MPIRICRENDVDLGSVSASSAVGSLPAVNVKDFDLSKIWRAAANSADLIWDAGSTQTLEVVMAQACNATLGDTFQVRASLTDPTVVSSLSYDSGVLPGINPVFGKFVHLLPAPASYRYGRLTFNQSTPPECGRLMAGNAFQPVRGISLVEVPESLSLDPSRRSLSIGQNPWIDELTVQRGYRITIRGISDAELHSEINELNRTRGTHYDWLLILNENSSDLGRDSIWGLMPSNATARRIPDMPGFWEVTIEIWERL